MSAYIWIVQGTFLHTYALVLAVVTSLDALAAVILYNMLSHHAGIRVALHTIYLVWLVSNSNLLVLSIFFTFPIVIDKRVN